RQFHGGGRKRHGKLTEMRSERIEQATQTGISPNSVGFQIMQSAADETDADLTQGRAFDRPSPRRTCTLVSIGRAWKRIVSQRHQDSRPGSAIGTALGPELSWRTFT